MQGVYQGPCNPAVYCKGCKCRLLKPSYDLMCGFCRIEIREAHDEHAKLAAKAA